MKVQGIGFLGLLFVSFVSAKSPGTISGRVVDATTGRPLARVNIVLKETTLGAATNSEGYYLVSNVPPGEYTVSASMIGFKIVTQQDILVRKGETTSLDFTLQKTVVHIDEGTLVTGVRPLLQRDVTQHTVTIRARELKQFPSVTRLGDVLQLQPNIVRDAELDELHLRGGRGGEILYLVDGMAVNDRLVGGESGIDIPVCEIEEIEIVTGGFNAEYGEAQSGLVNIVTKENSESHFGEILYRADPTGTHSTGYEFGSFLVQAPVWKTRCLFSGYADLTNTHTPTGRSRSTKEILGISFAEKQENRLGLSGKLFYKPFARASIVLTARMGQKWHDKYRQRWREIPDHTYGWERKSTQWSIKWNQSLSPTTSYTLTFGRFKTTEQYDPGKTPPELYALEQSYYAEIEQDRIPQDRGEPFDPDGDWFYEMGYDTTWHHHITTIHTLKGFLESRRFPEHQLKLGGEMNCCDLYKVQINEGWWFNEEWRDVPGPWPGYGWDRDYYHVYPHYGNVYIQDKFRAEELVFNCGLRFDYFATGNQISTQHKLKGYVSPRIGLSYPLSEKAVMHASYGHFYQMPEFQYIYMNPLYRGDLKLVGNPDLGPELTTAYELRYENLLIPSVLLSITGYKKNTRDLVNAEKIGSAPFYSYQLTNSSYGDAIGLEISIMSRANEYVEGEATYALSRATGKTSKDLESFEDWELSEALGEYPLIWDQRHSIYLRSTFKTPDDVPGGGGLGFLSGWEANLLWRMGSGLPYTPEDEQVESRLAKNSMRLPWSSEMNVKIIKYLMLKEVNLSGFVEVDNLWNRKNVRKFDTTPYWALVRDPSLTDPTALSPGRQVILGFEMSY